VIEHNKMKFPIKPVKASDFGGDVSGDPHAVAKYVANLENAGSDCLAFCLAERLAGLNRYRAAVILAPKEMRHTIQSQNQRTVVWVENPMASFVDILIQNGYRNPPPPGIRVAECGYFMADDAFLGEGTEIFPMAVVHEGTVTGANCRIQSGAIIGAVGLAYARKGQSYVRFPHLGRVVLRDNVDIGAGSVVVRGILQDTIIGSGTRVGNGVNIGHNVEIGKNCFISAGAVLAGSVTLHDGVWIAPNAVLLNGVSVGPGAKLAPGAILSKDAEAFYLYAGNPARVVKRVKK